MGEVVEAALLHEEEVEEVMGRAEVVLATQHLPSRLLQSCHLGIMDMTSK